MRWTYDAFLALHEAMRIRATGDNHVRPIEQVASVDPEWEQAVFTELAHLRWLEDYQRLPAELRGQLES